MKFLVVFIFVVVSLYAKKESCYSVQLISAINSEKNRELLSSQSYEATCKLMNINNTLTIRCGCYDTKEQAREHLRLYKQFYPKAYVNQTYRYRFAKPQRVIRKVVIAKEPRQEVVTIKEQKPFIYQREYDEAMAFYRAKKYKESYKIFSQIYLYKLDDPKLNFYLGKSAYEIGRYEVALAAFERVELLDPKNLENRLAMARTYYMLKMYTDSELAFQDVLKNPKISPKVKENIEFYFSRVSEVQKRSFTYATINADWIYDSNVNYASIDTQHTTSSGTLQTAGKVSDTALQLYGSITNLYDIGKKDGFYIKNRVTGLYKNYRDQDAYDMKYILYTPSILYGYLKHIFEVGIGVDKLVLGQQNYLHSISLTPSYGYLHTTTLRSMFSLKYQRKFFQRASEYDLNADHYELEYSLNKTLSPRSLLQGGVRVIKEKKHHGNSSDVNYNEYRANLLYSNQFTPIYATQLYGEYINRDYDDVNPLFVSTREDDGAILSATLKANISDTLKLRLKGMYNSVHSNQNLFSYNKHTISLGLNKIY